MTYKTLLFLLALAPISHGLEMISDEELMNFSGQNGVYLSGEMALNEFGLIYGQWLNIIRWFGLAFGLNIRSGLWIRWDTT